MNYDSMKYDYKAKALSAAATLATLLLLTSVAFAAGSISISSVTIPSSATVGDSFTLSAEVTVTDVGSVTGTLTLPSSITCSPTGSQSITISGSTGTGSWSCSGSAAGDFSNQITVAVSGTDSGDGSTKSASQQTGLTILSPASLAISSTITSTSILVGATTTFTVGVNNAGGSSTTFSIALSCPSGLSCSPSSVSSTSISGNSLVNNAFTITGSTAGSYTLTATVSSPVQASQSTSQSLTVTAVTTSPGSPASGPSGGPTVTTTPTTTPTVTAPIATVTEAPAAGTTIQTSAELKTAIAEVLNRTLDASTLSNFTQNAAVVAKASSITRDLRVAAGKSSITSTLTFTGDKIATDFVVYDKVPKSFAENAANITINAPGAKVRVVKADPEYAIVYPQVSPGQQLNWTYETAGNKTTAVLTQVKSEVYAGALRAAPAPAAPTNITAPPAAAAPPSLTTLVIAAVVIAAIGALVIVARRKVSKK